MPLTRNQLKELKQQTFAETANLELVEEAPEDAPGLPASSGTVGLPKKRGRGRPRKVVAEGEKDDTKLKGKRPKRLQSKSKHIRPKIPAVFDKGNIYRNDKRVSQFRLDPRKTSLSTFYHRKSLARAKSIALNRSNIKHANDSNESDVEYIETIDTCNQSTTITQQDTNMKDVEVMKNTRKFQQIVGESGVRQELEQISEEGINEIKAAGVRLQNRLNMVLVENGTDAESSGVSGATAAVLLLPEELDPSADGTTDEVNVKNDTLSSSENSMFHTAREHASWQSQSQLELTQYFDCEDNLPLQVELLPLDAIQEEDEDADKELTDNADTDEDVALSLPDADTAEPEPDTYEADEDEEVENSYDVTTYEENKDEDYRQILRESKTIPSWAGNKDELTKELFKQNPDVMKSLEASCPAIRGAIFPIMKKPYMKLFNIVKKT